MAVRDQRQEDPHTGRRLRSGRELRGPLLAGVVVGGLQAVSPFGFWWLTPATVYAVGLAFIAAVDIGFGVADGRPRVIVVDGRTEGHGRRRRATSVPSSGPRTPRAVARPSRTTPLSGLPTPRSAKP
jgi:hypothetical protein